ncbi:GDP-mannose 4,6-dehydratase, partial [Candidatus Gottesmanbacteria bacterium]|nr:GDP-mannose 4,6-dehydratase [Candidatus Gottesmanbacteria bacterium]
MKKVVVLGSNSFSGSDFISLILEQKKYHVVGISRSAEKNKIFQPFRRKKQTDYKFYRLDLNIDFRNIEKLISSFRPNYIVNFAAQSEVAPSWQHPEHWFETNTVSLARLLNYLRTLPFLSRYIHISSPEVYGTCRGLVKEDAALNPSTPYAASKAAADLLISTYIKNFNFPAVFVRSTNVYGAGQQLHKIIPRTVIYIKAEKKIELHGGGRSVKSYIHIRDISKGELLITEKGKIGQVYHLSPDKGIS